MNHEFTETNYSQTALKFLIISLCKTELPWDKPTTECDDYKRWVENNYTSLKPWIKLDTLSLSFVRKILVPNPEKRLTLERIQQHKWCQLSQLSTTGTYERVFISLDEEKSLDVCMWGRRKYITSNKESFFDFSLPSPSHIILMLSAFPKNICDDSKIFLSPHTASR